MTIINLYPPKENDQHILWLIGDGCLLPFAENAFDIVYSNSVIEHLRDISHQRQFAEEIRRVSNRYYVQTPNRRFVIEPHLLTPVIHFLPTSIQKQLLRNFTIWGWITRPNRQECLEFLKEVRLLDVREMQQLFPDAVIMRESVWGFTKSIIAIKNS